MPRSSCLLLFFGLLTLGACQTTGGPVASSAMAVSGRAFPPRGFVQFCQRNPGECDETSPSAGVRLDDGRWAELDGVNRDVNREIRYVSDKEAFGRSEHWTLPVDQGDCEDLALEKRRRLIAMGWPADSLLIALANVPRVGGHAVLVAVTDRGDYVLDVRDPSVRPWGDVGYQWLRRQSPTNPRVWEKISA